MFKHVAFKVVWDVLCVRILPCWQQTSNLRKSVGVAEAKRQRSGTGSGQLHQHLNGHGRGSGSSMSAHAGEGAPSTAAPGVHMVGSP